MIFLPKYNINKVTWRWIVMARNRIRNLAKGTVLLAGLMGINGYAAASEKGEDLYQAELVFGDLFKQVQIEKVMGDYKTFVDAIPLYSSEKILADYQAEKAAGNFNLKQFVLNNFKLPNAPTIQTVEKLPNMQQHLRQHWPKLVRHPQKTETNSSLIQLPNPYIVPGGRFREMFYWDSYFSIVGLIESDQQGLTKGILDNFAYLIDQFGYVPNGNRSYFLSRSQPPFFAATVLSYADKFGLDAVVQYIPQLEKEYLFWMDGYSEIPKQAVEGKHLIVLENGDYFNRYYGALETPRAEAYGKEYKWALQRTEAERPQYHRDLRAACESGWDFSSRWFADGKSKKTTHTMDVIPVDLNSLLYQLESVLVQLTQHTKQQNKAHFYTQRLNKRKQLIDKYHFDGQKGIYQDYNYKLKQFTGRESLAMMYPLFVGAADKKTAASVAKYIDQHFLHAGGLVTTLTQTGEQWDYPNGWAPLQYLSVKGLLRYQQNELATTVMQRWLALNEKVYQQDGKMMEKYNVVDINLAAGGGEYPNQDGFGWTNGVAIAFDEMLQAK